MRQNQGIDSNMYSEAGHFDEQGELRESNGVGIQWSHRETGATLVFDGR